MRDTDVIVIGAGLLGCFAAMNLAKYELDITVLEKNADVSCGISKANSGIVYSGLDAKPGTQKSAFCVHANRTFDELCRNLDVPFLRCGSLLLSFGDRGDSVIRKKYEDGLVNQVPELEILGKEEILALEPEISKKVRSALYAGTTGSVNPWELCIAAYECSVNNGARFVFNSEVRAILREGKTFIIETQKETYRAKAVINCAGLKADCVRELAEKPLLRIFPTASDYLVTDTTAGGFVKHVIFHEPEEKSKGLTLVPTTDGNLLIGPTERKTDGLPPEELAGNPTKEEGFEQLYKLCREVVPDLPLDSLIRSFGSQRPNPFWLEEKNGQLVRGKKDISGFTILEEQGLISFIGIKTPGMTCANELGNYAAEKAAEYIGNVQENPKFDPVRKNIPAPAKMPLQEREAFVASCPEYGRLICRCRHVSEGEVTEAVRRGANSIESVKHRTGAGLGRCQGAFCALRVEKLLQGRTETVKTIRPLSSCDILIIGAGAAGMGAAMAAKEAGAETVYVIERDSAPGGILNQCLHHGFGLAYFKEDLTGVEYAERVAKEFAQCGAELFTDTMVTEIRPDRTAVLSSCGNVRTVRFEQCILASGCRERTLASLPTAGTRPAGIYTAGEAQKRINVYQMDIGDDIIILGTGDIGQIVAGRLKELGKNVICMIEKNDVPGGLPRNRKNTIEKYKIPVILRSTVTGIHGEGRITGVTIKDLVSGTEQVMGCGTLITALGLVPEQDLIAPLSADGNLPDWLWLSGNCSYVHDIVDTVSAEARQDGGLVAGSLNRPPLQA